MIVTAGLKIAQDETKSKTKPVRRITRPLPGKTRCKETILRRRAYSNKGGPETHTGKA